MDGTLTRGTESLGYTGVWNRNQDVVNGEIRITGGNYRMDVCTQAKVSVRRTFPLVAPCWVRAPMTAS